MAGIICPEKKKKDISKISLSHQIISRWNEEIGKSIEKSLESKAANLKFYALVVDDNTDATDLAQIAISVRGVDDKYNVTEEMAFLVQLLKTQLNQELYTKQ